MECFPRDTVVQVDNMFPIPLAELDKTSIEGLMPEDFHARFVQAIKDSVLLTRQRQKFLLEKLRET